MGRHAQLGDNRLAEAGSVVRTLYGMSRVGIVSRIEVVVHEAFFAGKREAREEVRVWVRWQDDHTRSETDTSPDAISCEGVPVVEGLALVGEVAS